MGNLRIPPPSEFSYASHGITPAFLKPLALVLLFVFAGVGQVLGETTTYQHVFTAKPSTGNNVSLSGVSWNITASNLGSYNSTNYAGVQFGSGGKTSKAGNITLTSPSSWGSQEGSYKGKTKITQIRVWLNQGANSVSATVTIGGNSVSGTGTVTKNSSAGSNWRNASCITFTPSSTNNTGVVVITATTGSNKIAGYICCVEIDCEEEESCSNKVTITNNTTTNVSHGSFTVDKTGAQDACEALSVTVTPDPDDHCHVTSVSATNPATTGTAGEAVDNGDGTYTITYSANASGNSTINVEFAENLKHTIHFKNNGETAHDDIVVYEGENIGDALPVLQNSEACHATSKTFAGWTTEDIGSTPVHTVDVNKIVDYWTEPTQDMTLNALWATTSNTPQAQFIAENEEAKVASENDPVSLIKSGITLYYESGNVYHNNNNTAHNFGINANTSCAISADGLVLEKIVTTCSGNNYRIYNISDGTLSNDKQSVADVRTSELYLFASTSNPLRIVTMDVYCYDNYITSCCTPLAQVEGSDIVIQTPTSVQLTWNAVEGAEKYQVKVPGSTSHNDWTDVNTTSVEVTGLACGTAHTAYFRAIDTNGSHCAEGPESTKEIPAMSWTVTVTGVTHATPNEAWPATACADFSRTLTVEPGYEFPTSLTVVGADYSWAKNTGELTIKNITGNVSITFTPTVKTYTITYKDQGGGGFSGTQTDAPTSHTYGTATTLKIPTKANYSFGGWFTSVDCTTGAVGDAESATLGATDYTADIVLYAKWVANQHTLTYSEGDSESGSVPAEPTLYNHGHEVTVLGNTGELAKEHYVFETWTDGENEYGEGDNFNIYDDVTLSPKWACNEYVNVLKGTPTNGSFELSATGSRYTCAGDEIITVTPSANTGYVFSAIEVTGVASAINQTAKTVTYAQYAHGASTINVTFAPVVSAITWDLNYQGAPEASSTDYTYAGEALELPAPTRTGYDFVGWFTDPTDGSQIDNVGGTNKPYAATTYYAHWTIHSYTVTFKNNGVTLVSGGTSNVNYGAAYGTLPVLESGDACDGTSTTFMGWSSTPIAEKTDEVPALVSAETTMGANDVELHAVWAKAEGGVGYELVSTLVSGKKYIFVSSNTAGSAYAVYASNISTSTAQNVTAPSKSITISSGTPVRVITEDEDLEFAYDGTDFQIVKQTGYYLFINGNGISRRTDKRAYWDDGKGLYGQNNDKNKNYYLYLNGSNFDKATTPSNGARVYAFQKCETSYSDYITKCCDAWSATAKYGESNSINVGDAALAATITGTTYGTATYESSNTAVLTVADDGKITGVKAGNATVTISWAGDADHCAYETTVDVTVNGTISLTYNANDGSDTPATKEHSATLTSNSAFTLEANTFNKTGYSFVGWALTADGDKEYDNSQADVILSENTVLYAIWTINSHAITVTQPTGNTIEVTGAANVASVPYNTLITLTATENEGYVFTGWSATNATLADESAKSTTFNMPDADVAVSANYSTYTWDLTGYTVTTAPKLEYTKVEKFSTAAVVIKQNFKRSDNNELTKQEDYKGEWTAKLNGVVIANGADLSLGDDGKTLKLYIGEEEIASYTLVVTDIPTDQFVDGLWGESFEIQSGTYSLPTPSAHAAGNAATCKDHNIFMGWVLAANIDDLVDANIITAGTSTTAANNIYHAVWAKQVTGPKEFELHYGWETGDATTGWNICNISAMNETSDLSAHDGSKYVKIGGSTVVIKTASSIAKPKKMTVWIARSSNNTNNTLFKIGTCATINGTYSDAISASVGSLLKNKNEWYKLEVDLSTQNNVYVQFQVTDNGADRLIDDVTLTYEQEATTNTDYITDCETRYEISFDANGGEGSYESILKKEGKTIALPDGSALSKQWHNFDGWKVYNAATAEEIAVTENSFTTPAANVNVVAQWQEVSKAKVVYMNGDVQYSTRTNIHEGQEYTIAGKPADQEGKLFIGWKNTLTSDTMKVKDPALKVIMPTPAVDIRYDALWLDVLPEPTSSTVDAADLSNGEWVLVTANNQLRTGDIVIVAAEDYSFALGNTQNSSNRASVSITKSEDKQRLSNPDGNVAKLFLQNGIGAGEYALYDYAYVTNETNGGYLYAAGNSSNDLKTKTSLDRDASWTISIDNNGTATIKAKGQYSHNWLRYNNSGSNNLFSCYESGQNDVVLYKWVKKISGNMNISNVTLTDAVIVKNGATLTVDAASSLVDLTVEAGGKVETTNELTVINNLTIESEAGKSGQVSNAGNVYANNVYMDVTFYKSATELNATSANQWYMISAPFNVNLNGGFLQTDGTPMVFGSDFDLFEYDGAKRANTGVTGWKRVSGQMKAGTACLIGFNEGQATTIRLKAANASLAEKGSITLNAYSGDAQNQNWNGVANPNLHYVNINKDVQIYNNEEGENGRKYMPYTASDYSFVVGTAFFVQETGSISLEAGSHSQLRAPKRESERYEACVRIVRDGAETFADQMFVRASEDASAQYEQGHDMVTWNGTTAKTALLWTENYGTRLAIEEAPLLNNQASYALGLYAPANGTYRIEVANTQTDATLYLTQGGTIIWNLTDGAYEVDLTAGTTSEYGLLLQANAPQIPTGVEEVGASKAAQKVVIDDHVYILRGEKMYDTTGKMVK